ncbi:MAG: formate/nitrite transporter family protein [Hungatella sp.]|jgi:formate/nitrite transporter FocA (FNT family)|nr:formate/nitrite transporter family protein [Hungatella sp.]MDR2022546.1 formate/nitrite transporter family protein [Hungatella sp.]
MKTFINAIIAGIAISIGGVIYLTLENHIAGSFLFSIGLFTIYTFGFNLYTGKVCYIVNEKPSYLKTILIVYIGNFAGTVGAGIIFKHTKLVRLVNHTSELVNMKLSDTLFSTFIMAVMCGVMMCIAVIGYQTVKDGIGKYLSLIMPIMVFILSGYEHSIADMFYFTMGNAWNAKAFLYILVISAGNLAGGNLIPLAKKYLNEEASLQH